MNKKFFSYFAVMLTVLLFFSCAEKQQTPDSTSGADKSQNTAVLVLSIGQVRVSQGSAWKDAEINMELKSGDEIETGDRSKCNIVIGKDSYISVKENSKLVIQDLSLDKDGSENTTVELKIGKGVINPKKLLKQDSFNVKTPTSVAAVRGTKFTVETNPGEVTKISVVEGKVQLKKRISALENSDLNESSSEIADKLNEKIEKESIIIDANQSAEIDNIKVEEINTIVAEVIKDNNEKDVQASPELKEQISEKITKITASMESEEIIQKTGQIDPAEKQDVNDLENYVKDNKAEIKKAVEIVEKNKVAETAETPAAENNVEPEKIKDLPNQMKLFVVSPQKNSSIYIDGRLKGRGRTEYILKENEKVNVLIKTAGYNDYNQEVMWENVSEKNLNAALVKTKLLNRVAWKITFPGEIKGSVLDSGNRKILTSTTGKITCVNSAGEIIWTNELSGGIDSVPVLSGNRLFVGTKDGNLHSLNALNGKTVFKTELDGALLFNTAPVVSGKDIYAGTSNGKVYRMDFDGKIKWSQDIQAGVYATPLLVDSTLYVGTDSKFFFALNSGNGKISWQTELDSRIITSSPVAYKKNIIACTYSGTMYLLDMKKGKVVRNSEYGNPILSTPLVRGNDVVFALNDGNLYSVEIETGKVNWQKKLGGSIVNSPVAMDNSLYLSSGNNMYDIDIRNGNVNWSYNLGEKIKTTAAYGGNSLVLGTENGTLFSLRKDLRDIAE